MARRAADYVVEKIQEAILTRGRAMIALAGGSTPMATYDRLAQPEERNRIDWSKTYVFFGDERFVPLDDPESNFARANRALLSAVPIPRPHIYPIPTQVATAEEAAEQYQKDLAKTFGISSSHEPPQFDLILLGLGQDGHTASLFPGAPSLSVTDRWLVASAPGTLRPYVERVTFTFPILNAARNILFLVSGSDKATALREVVEGDVQANDFPAGGIRPSAGTVTWIVDLAASAKLDMSRRAT